MLSGFSKKSYYDSEIEYGYYNREDSACAAIDAGVGAVFGMGTVASRTDFVEFMTGYFYFRVSNDLAASNKCGVYFGLSCGLGEFDRPVIASRGPDLCSQFLFDGENKGASFWIGPSSNTRYYSNYYFGHALIEQLFCLGARTTSEACFLALRRVMLEHPEFSEVWEGHNFFGSPFHVMHGMKAIEYTDAADFPGYKWELRQNYPNPFNPATRIEYMLEKSCHVSLKIYNVTGQLVRTLVDEHQKSGSSSIIWNGRDERGRRVASGVYFYRLEAGEFVTSKKIVLLR